MSQRLLRPLAWITTGVLFVAGSAVLAQSALAQLGATEQDAQYWVRTIVNGGVTPGGFGSTVTRTSAAYKKLPAGARATVTTGIYAWAKAYVNTPAIKAEYARRRAKVTPQPRLHVGTVDDELKVKMAETRAELDATLKALIQMKQSTAQIDAARKRQEATLASIGAVLRTEIERQRVKDKADYELLMKEWQTSYPANSLGVVASVLRGFLAATTDVDFTAKAGPGQPGDDVLLFTNPAHEAKPWQWKVAYEFGPEAIAAARAAAQAWVNEIGTK